MRVSPHKIIMQVVYEGRSMQIYELAPQNLAHPIDVARVSPVRVMHACEHYSLFLAIDSRQHHVCRVY